MEFKAIKHEFLLDLVRHGVGDTLLPPKLRQWERKFFAPIPEKGAGRWANRFEIKVSVELDLTLHGSRLNPLNLGLVGKAFVGTTAHGTRVRVRGITSRRVVDVVGGVGMGLNFLRSLGPELGKFTKVRVEFSRKKGNIQREMDAVERAVETVLHVLGMRMDGFVALEPYVWRLPGVVGAGVWELMTVLTVMKLAVLRPELWEQGTNKDIKYKIRSVLAWWKGLDDDARLLFGTVGQPRARDMGWELTPKTVSLISSNYWLPVELEITPEIRARVVSLIRRVPQGEWGQVAVDILPKELVWAPKICSRRECMSIQKLWARKGVELRLEKNYTWAASNTLFEGNPDDRDLVARLLHTKQFGMIGTDAELVEKPLSSKVLFKG